MRPGLDYKAIGNYEKVVLEEHPNGFGGGGFVNLDGFKKSVPSIDRLLDTGRCPLFRYDLAWNDNHKFDASYRAIVRANAKAIRPVISEHKNVLHFANPVTEHKLNERDWLVFADIVLQELGNSVTLVNVPLPEGFVSKTYHNEFHGGRKPRPGVKMCYSSDGISSHDLFIRDLWKAYEAMGAAYFFVWISQFNGNRKVGESDPRNRRIYWPTNKQMDAVIYLLNNEVA